MGRRRHCRCRRREKKPKTLLAVYSLVHEGPVDGGGTTMAGARRGSIPMAAGPLAFETGSATRGSFCSAAEGVRENVGIQRSARVNGKIAGRKRVFTLGPEKLFRKYSRVPVLNF